ncbi:MAG: tetratricopeptide repeat protein [Candidatus Glassbacteria bacterium]|nr:tetratricopeptide repeat protein [Candidatus Glassbacteria bacterium]
MSSLANDKGLSNRQHRLWLWILAATFAVTVAVYWQTSSFGFVNYDDTVITRSGRQIERGLSPASLKRIFTPVNMATYQPLRDLAVEAVYEFSGTEPAGYHRFNLMLYLANLAAVCWLLNLLLGLFGVEGSGSNRTWAAVGTALFALHPVHVEAVAWMNSGKELLAGLFYFLALGLYIGSRGRSIFSAGYAASWICFVLGMLAKPSGAAFPLVVAALELSAWSSGRKARETAARISPYLALSVLAGFYFALRTTAAMDSWLQGSGWSHMLSMASVLGRYVLNLLVPVNLCHSYPPPFFFGEYDWRFGLDLLIDISLVGLIYLFHRRGRSEVAFGLAFFLLNLLPVSGLVPIAIFMADRYLYIPSFGLVLAAVAGLRWLWSTSAVSGRRAAYVAGVVVMLACMTAISYSRCGDWRNAVTLWRSAVLTHGNFQFNHYGLGNAYYKAGRREEALAAYRNANRFRENFSCLYSIGRIQDQLGDTTSARVHFARAAEIFTPDMTGQMQEMAHVYRRLGRREDLAGHLVNWGKVSSDDTAFTLKLADELAGLGYPQGALELITAASSPIEDKPGFYLASAREYLEAGFPEVAAGVIGLARRSGAEEDSTLLLEADLAFARGEWENSAALYTDIGESRLDPLRLEHLAAASLHGGNPSRALALFRLLASSGGEPSPAGINNIGAVLEALDSLTAAEGHFREAVALDSAYADAWYNLGRVLADRGEVREALNCFSRTRSLEGPGFDTDLAIARLYSRLGRLDSAMQYYAAALSFGPRSAEGLLEAADTAWRAGERATAANYYKRLQALVNPANLPPRVLRRAQ